MAELSSIESVLDKFGLMRGENAPLLRAAVGGLVGGVIVQYFQPYAMYEAGAPRPWSLISKDPKATPLPWFAVPAFGAFVMGVLI